MLAFLFSFPVAVLLLVWCRLARSQSDRGKARQLQAQCHSSPPLSSSSGRWVRRRRKTELGDGGGGSRGACERRHPLPPAATQQRGLRRQQLSPRLPCW